MDEAQMLMMTYGKYFKPIRIQEVKAIIEQLGTDKATPVFAMADFKDPTTILLISIFLGGFGVDRFMIGDTNLGIIKLVAYIVIIFLTILLCGIPAFLFFCFYIDCFFIQDATRDKNYEKLINTIQFQGLQIN